MELIRTQANGRLICALQRGGVAVAQNTGWAVCRTKDSRRTRIGLLTEALVDDLVSAGSLTRLDGDSSRLIWVDGKTYTGASISPPVSLPVNSIQNSTHRRSFLEQAVYLQGCDIERRRLLSAALRFNGDAEQAMTPASMTMRWDPVRVDHGNSGYSPSGPGELAMRAAANLRRIRQFVGEDVFAILQLVLVTEVSRAGLARRMDIAPRAALKRAGAALICLADAYDTAVPASA